MKIKRLHEVKETLKSDSENSQKTGSAELELKIQELIVILNQSVLDNDQIKNYQGRISDAFQKSQSSSDLIQPFKELNEENNLSREELLDSLEKLLVTNKIDSNVSRKYLRQQTFQKLLLCFIAVILIVTGFAMIIMPAPPSFELFTVFYFNSNDGVTIMDLVSLLIILSGVFLFVLNFNKK